MSLSTKILITISTIVVLCLGAFLVYKQIDTANKLSEIQKSIVETKQLVDNISRAQAQYASKEDVEAFAKQQDINLDAIKKDLATLDAQVKAIDGITVVSHSQVGNNLPSTSTTPRTDGKNTEIQSGTDPYGYMRNTQHLDLTEKFSNVEVPFGTVGFSAWKDKPWDLQIAERKYSVTSVLGEDQEGRHYSYSKFSITSGGKRYDVKIDDNKFMEEYPDKKFSFFNPRLFLTSGGAVNLTSAPIAGSANIGATVGIMSYGQFKNAPDISILQVGAAYQTGTQTASAIINPVSFNLKGIAPKGLINNTYVGPSMGVDTKGNVFAGANLSVGF